MMNPFASKEYKEGYRSGTAGIDSRSNPYMKDAELYNIHHMDGMSPEWDTDYKPFLDWKDGHADGSRPRMNKYFKDLIKATKSAQTND